MSHFTPAKIISTFTAKNNQVITLRYPKWEDLPSLHERINDLSREDTYSAYSGENISYWEENRFLSQLFFDIENQDQVALVAEIDNRIVGYCSVIRKLATRRRSHHIGIFGMSIAKEFRGQGIGYALAQATIVESKNYILGLKLIILDVFESNHIAHSMYEKLGFRDYGRLPSGTFFHDEYIGVDHMYLNI